MLQLTSFPTSLRRSSIVQPSSSCQVPTPQRPIIRNGITFARSAVAEKAQHASTFVVFSTHPHALPAAERDATATASTSGNTPQTAPIEASGQSQVSAESPEKLHDDQLYKELKACETYQDVFDVIADEASTMGLRRAVQALSKLHSVVRRLPRSQQLSVLSLGNQGFGQLCAVLHANVSTMNPMQLSTVLHCFAQLHVGIAKPTLSQYAARCGVTAPDFMLRDIATALHAYATMEVSPGKEVLDKLGFRARFLLDAQVTLATAVSPKAAAPQADSSASDEGDTPSTAGEGAAHASSNGSTQAEGSAPSAKFLAQDVAVLLQSCANIKYTNSQLLDSAAAMAAVYIRDFQPQGMSNMMWAFAKLGYYPEQYPELIKGVLEHVSKAPKDFRPQEMCNLMWALTSLRHHPGATLKPMVQSLLERLRELRAPDFTALLSTFAAFGVRPGPVPMAKLCSAMEAALPRFSAMELCICYRSLGLLNETARPAFRAIGRTLPEHYAKGRLKDEGLQRMAFQGLLCAKLAAPSKAELEEAKGAALNGGPAAQSAFAISAALADAANPPFTTEMLDEMRRAWVGAMHHGRHPPAELQALLGTLRALRVRFEGERQPTKDGLYAADVVLRPTPERMVALQVLYPHEHTRNTGQFLGVVQLERQVLERNGFEVKYLRALDFNNVEPWARPTFVADLVRSVGGKVNDAAVEAAVAEAGHRQRRDAGPSGSNGDGGGRSGRPQARAPRQRKQAPGWGRVDEQEGEEAGGSAAVGTREMSKLMAATDVGGQGSGKKRSGR